MALEDYALKERVGTGGMAEVFKAVGLRGANKDRTVAVKRLLPNLAADPMYVDAFVGEADVSRHLRHPAIVSVLETGVEKDTYYIVMEFIEGRDLAQLMRITHQQGVKLSVDLCCYIVHVLALALDYAHRVRTKNGDAMGIVHCDVTPSNVFISNSGQVRLGDFGVAHSKLIASAMAERGYIAGKVSYLAPEQIIDENVAPATDVFALGAILFEMVAGRKAFQGKSSQEIMDKIVDGAVPRLGSVRDNVPPEVERIVNRALTTSRAIKTPTLSERLRAALPGTREPRYATAAHMAIDLEKAYDPKVGTEAALASLLRGLFK